jgi:hypothetical protein
MTEHTSRLCKGYLTNKVSDGALHQMTWPPQLPNFNTTAFQVKLVERMPRVCKAVIKAKGGLFEESQI